jgi:aminoglycoside phosphotransferase (APT) family kinase protein
MALIDQGGAIRHGEELDIQKVDAWLRPYLPDLAEGLPIVTQYAGGASNWTYRLKYQNHDLILRRPPAGTKAKGAHDMSREYLVQKQLKTLYPVVADMIALCTDHSIMGSDFYIMRRIEGIIPRANLPKELTMSEAEVRTLCTNTLDQLIALHQVDYRSAGLESLGKGDGYCKRQIDGWCDRYQKVQTWNVPSYKGIQAWLKENTPADSATCVIHNDWRFDNVVLDPAHPTQVIGVLDWEMATLGDPLMELGNVLSYWTQATDKGILRKTRRQPTHLAGMLTRSEVVDYYTAKTGIDIKHWAFYEVAGLFRVAAIVQQIYYRYYHKQTDNPAFKYFWLINWAIWRRCRQTIHADQANRG